MRLTFRPGSSRRILDIISDAGFTASNGESKRLIKQGGVSIDDDKIDDTGFELTFEENKEYTLKVGKRNFAILEVRK